MKSFRVFGKVQNVMFRQTFIRGLQARSLRGGATNNNDAENTVSITIDSSDDNVTVVIQKLLELKVLNSWNATVEKIEELPDAIPTLSHQVTTENVDEIKWSEGVEFYF
jgi:acylphosphatase